jgi:DNA-binding response OmpR family regulator
MPDDHDMRTMVPNGSTEGDVARILVVDDDAVSRQFLVDVLADAGHAVDHAADGRAALTLARAAAYDWLVTDLRLPGLRGTAWLQALRGDAQAPSRVAPALVLSAELDAADRAEVAALPLANADTKPLRASVLVGHLHAALRGESPPCTTDGPSDAATGASRACLDDASALAATGSADVMQGLRELLAAELPERVADLDYAIAERDIDTVRAVVHRLRAACGFCGAVALAAHLEALRRLDDADVLAERWPGVRDCAEATRNALAASTAGDARNA